MKAFSSPPSPPLPSPPSPPFSSPGIQTGAAPLSLDGERRLKKGEWWSCSTSSFSSTSVLLAPYCTKRKLRVRMQCFLTHSLTPSLAHPLTPSLRLFGSSIEHLPQPPDSCTLPITNMHHGETWRIHVYALSPPSLPPRSLLSSFSASLLTLGLI